MMIIIIIFSFLIVINSNNIKHENNENLRNEKVNRYKTVVQKAVNANGQQS